ncbi:MAG: hypothetical protein HYS81_02895 [Candidatus Aenigmatarchaeota archaeon]|nr:MAG: hypothetical protein HYS81_02895 [Candidatus Aenigmarchaeota archaeon]
MSFHNLGTGSNDIADILLRQVLKVPDCVGTNTYGCITGVPQHDLLFAFFVPHIVLLIYIYIISRGMHTFQENKALGTLFGLAVYIMLVYSGWYGILASWLIVWLWATIAFGLGYFFLTRIWHPADVGARFKLGQKFGEKLKSRHEDQEEERDRSKDVEKLKKRLEREQKKTVEVRRDYDAATDPRRKRSLERQLDEQERLVRDIQRQIDDLEA